MNPIYYLFLVIIVISFVTGLIITVIDNIKGEPIENDVPVKKQKVAVSNDAPVRSSSLNDTLQNVPAISVDTNQSVVPYLPVENDNIPVFAIENSPVDTKPIISSMVQPSEHQIQINDANDAQDEYYAVPVLIPMPMDDDIL